MEKGLKGTGIVPADSAGISSFLINPRFLKPDSKSADDSDLKVEGGLGILPIELTVDILSRLPFKDLLRFKLLSKSLCTLISSPDFAHSYLKESLGSDSNSPFLMVRDIAACYSIELSEVEEPDGQKSDHPQARGTEIVGSSNGLTCIRNGRRNRISLYNPSIREQHELPALPEMSLPQGSFPITKWGFGYDNASDDYKVLMISIFYSSTNLGTITSETMIYCLKRSSWRKTFPCLNLIGNLDNHGVLCNESLYWVSETGQGQGSIVNYDIVGFELHNESFHQVPIPNHDHKFDGFSLGTLNGCLCASALVNASRVDYFIVWVMKDCGNKDPWTRLFHVGNLRSSITHMRPIAYSDSEDEVLVDISRTHFLWFDVKRHKIIRYVNCHHSSAVLCLQSLLSPRSVIQNLK